MDASSLPTLPISFMTALVSLLLLAMILMSTAGNRASRTAFSLLFGVFCLQAILVGLRFGYGFSALASLQRALPFTIGPLIYLGFRALADANGLERKAILPHALAGSLPMIMLWAIPLLTDPEKLPPAAQNAADVLIGLSFVLYLALLIRLYRQGSDVFEATGFEIVWNIRRWLLGAILLLAFMLILDSAIAFDFALASGRGTSSLIAIGSAVFIPTLLAAALLYPTTRPTVAAVVPRPADHAETPSSSDDAAADEAVIDALGDLLGARGLHRDPDLTLSRLARRLGIPARQVSSAVNRARGLNVSQFVNDHRIAYAMQALADDDRTIAEVMTAAGFRTKSNFNREFKRVAGESPMDYRRRHHA